MRWWNVLNAEQMVAALYGATATEDQAVAAQKMYADLDDATKAKVNGVAEDRNDGSTRCGTTGRKDRWWCIWDTVRGTTHKAGVGGAPLDLVKHVLRRDEANALRWLKDKGLIDCP